jgi:hypothetical protein
MMAKKCPTCAHPMMEGPLGINRDGNRITVQWWCAGCHHYILPRPTKGKS